MSVLGLSAQEAARRLAERGYTVSLTPYVAPHTEAGEARVIAERLSGTAAELIVSDFKQTEIASDNRE